MSRVDLPPDLSPVERSALLPILGRAQDAESRRPILGDTWASVVVAEVSVDWDHLGLPRKEASTVAARARLIDDAARRFLEANPRSCVLDLGSGLDDRAQRVDPPEETMWFDVDLPGIMSLRRRLATRPVIAAAHHELEVDATSAEWVDSLPSDRPLVILADGFFPFLAERDAEHLVHRLVEHAPHGELVMNGYTTLARTLMPRVRAIRDLGIDTAGGTAFDDPHEPEKWHPRLRLADRTMLSRSPYVDRMPRGLRAAIAVMNAFPGLAERSDLGVLRFTF
ncbi:class I SAM-dependent methyltransferase [Microbacterium sp. AZCO]|uniref:class I SAM-dependent methyltransferase n=1 Tax=Microbacterium sp. AZCO TaxID=3142976 RepID=UPI0031F3FD0E